MIKALTDTGFVILGLTSENVKGLQDDKPIVFDLAELGLEPRQVAIVYGDDANAIVSKLTEGRT